MGSVSDWIARLKKAFDAGLFGWGTDQPAVETVLREATQAKQMAELKAGYPELEDQLIGEFSGDSRKEVMRLFHEFTDEIKTQTTAFLTQDPTWAAKLYDAFDGLGTDEGAMMTVLDNAAAVREMCELTNSYQESYRADLELELYSELSGDELRDALRAYYGGFNLGAFTCQVYGTLAPNACMVSPASSKRWEDAVMRGLDKMRQLRQQHDAPRFGSGVWDDVNWSFFEAGATGPHQVAYVPRIELAKAIDSFALPFQYQDPKTGEQKDTVRLALWKVDCATYGEMALLNVWREYLADDKAFNAKFAGFVLYSQHSKKLPIAPAIGFDDRETATPEEIEKFDANWDCAPAGTKVSWISLGEPLASDYRNEFGVKRTGGAGARYDAFPLGFDVDESEIKLALARHAPDFPGDSAAEAYIAKNILRFDYSIPILPR